MQFNAQQSQYKARHPNADFNIIVSDDKPIGYFYVSRREDSIELIDIALLADQVSKGVGTHLVSALKAEALGQNRTIVAHVEKSNTGAWKLWQRLGFNAIADDGVYLKIECRADTHTPSMP